MSLRSLRAADAVSSSASTTIRPPTMCSPPANLNVADTSALRQHGLVTASRLSSALTIAVIAMRAILSLVSKSGEVVSETRPPQLLRPSDGKAGHYSICRSWSSGLSLIPTGRCQDRCYALDPDGAEVPVPESPVSP